MAIFLKWAATFIGTILKSILPGIMKQGRKPRDVSVGGFDEELKEDIDDSIEREIEDSINDSKSN